MNKEVALENFVWNMLEQDYGEIRYPVSHELKHSQLIAVINWNILITAMATYQYWKQKEVK